jgi:hypothetical protein
VAGRVGLLGDRTSATYHAGIRRLTEENTLDVKNRSHRITAGIDVDDEARGVIISQGGRFGGWTLYCLEGRPCYEYNYFGLERSTVRATEQLGPGPHEVRVDFAYDGGGVGLGGRVTLRVDGRPVGECRVARTIPYYFSFDETLDVGVALGTPVSDDYADTGEFTGTVHHVRIDLTGEEENRGDEGRDGRGLHRRVMTAQ